MSESDPIKTENMDVEESSTEHNESTEKDTSVEMSDKIFAKKTPKEEPVSTEIDTKDDNIKIKKEFLSEELASTENDTNETKIKTMDVVESPPTTSAGNVEDSSISYNTSKGMTKARVEMINKLIQDSIRRRRKRKRNKRKAKLRAKRLKAESSPCKAGPSHCKKEIRSDTYSSTSEEENFSFMVSNLPLTWTYTEIKNYLDKQCDHVDDIELLKHENSNEFGAIKLTFQNSNDCLQAMKKLHKKDVEGNQLHIKMNDDQGSVSDVDTIELGDFTDKKPWRPDIDPWEVDPDGIYGLKLPFLTSLNIIPPIDKWVQVSNFRCDKSELRDVMELAGHVLLCSVFTIERKYANVMYNHPLEAVQAVSMLNGQKLYGKALKVTMNKTPNETIILPKGLSSVGTGLGKNGKPVRNIAEHYKRYLNKQPASVNRLLFEAVALEDDITDDTTSGKDEEISKKPLKIINVGALNKYEEDQDKDDGDSDISADEVNVASPNSVNQNETRKLSTNTPSVPNASIIPSNIPDINIHSQFGPIGSMVAAHTLVSNPGYNSMAHISSYGPSHFPRTFFPNPAVPPRPPSNFGPRPFVPGGPIPHPNGHPRQPLNLSGPRQPMNLSGPPRPPMNPIGPPRQPLNPIGLPRQPLNLSGPLRHPHGGPQEPNLMGAPMPRSFSYQISNKTGSSTVEMCNLPPNTTFPLLCERLSHCGQVVSLQFTTPGCAVVVFAQRAHAEMCYQKYNRYTVDGYMIEVKYRFSNLVQIDQLALREIGIRSARQCIKNRLHLKFREHYILGVQVLLIVTLPSTIRVSIGTTCQTKRHFDI